MADLNKTLHDIADAIKEKLGTNADIAPVDFADAVLDIPVDHGGYDDPTPIITGDVKTVSNTASFTRAGCLAYCSKLTTANLSLCETVGSSTFYECTKLRAVHLENCRTISENAFYSCSALSKIDLPLVENISNYGFFNCALTSISFPECVTIGDHTFQSNEDLSEMYCPKVEWIGEDAFYYCGSLKSLDAPACISISSGAFIDCYALSSVSLPNCETLGAFAFYGCGSSFPSSISLPKVKEIGGMTFRYTSLETIYIPECLEINNEDGSYHMGYNTNIGSGPFPSGTMKVIYAPKCYSIGYGAFYGCSLESLVLDFSNISHISNGAFTYTNLSYISLPNCTGVGSWGFSAASNLKEAYMPLLGQVSQQGFNYCTKLSKLAENNILINLSFVETRGFAQCYSLPSITLYKCYLLSYGAFELCNRLSAITILSSSCRISTNTFANTPLSLSSYLGYYGSIYVRSEYVNYYKTSSYWSAYADRITALPDNGDYIFTQEFESQTIENIPSNKINAKFVFSNAFNSCINLSSVSLPECLLVENSAFKDCSSLEEITLPKCLSIGDSIIYNCSNLKTINMPKLKNVPNAFTSGVSNLETIIMPEATVIGASAFASKNKLEEINLPKCSNFASYAFSDCANLKTVNASQCCFVQKAAFFNCANLSTINLSSFVGIYDSAFYSCSSLTSFSANVFSLGYSAFQYCKNLSYISLGSINSYKNNYQSYALGTIPPYTFEFCINLKSIVLPEAITYIGETAFYGCSKLESVYILYSSVVRLPSYTYNTPFAYTPMSDSSYLGYYGSIYVRESLVEDYKTHSMWSYYADRITGLTDNEIEALINN